MENFLQEAFKRLSLLEDDFNYSELDTGKIDELKSFVPDDVEVPEVEEIDVIDTDAQNESELEDIYEGKIILECECCHSRIYKDKEDVVITDGLANEEEACPVCGNALGFTVIGKIEAFDPNKDVESEADNIEDGVEPEEVNEPIEDEEETEESLKNHPLASEDSKKLDEEAQPSLADRLSRKHLESLKNQPLASEDSKKLDEGCDCDEAANGSYDTTFDRDFDAAVDELDELPPDDLPDPWGANLHRVDTRKNAILGKGDDNGFDEYDLDAEISKPVEEADPDDEDEFDVSEDCHKESLTEAKSSLDNKPWKLEGEEGEFDEDEFTDYYDSKYPDDGTPFEFDDTMCYIIDIDEDNLEKVCEDISKKLGIDIEGYPDLIDHDQYTYKQIADYIHEVFKACGEADEPDDEDESLTEDINIESPVDVQVEENGKVTIEPTTEEPIEEIQDEAPVEAEGAEEIVPLDDEEQSEIEANDAEDEEDEFDFDDFDEEEFDNMGESFVRKVYENVNSYKTTAIKSTGSVFIIEGLINFKSGKSKKTEFVFENKRNTKSGKLVLEGYNKTFSNKKNTFTVKGIVNESRYIPMLFKYNYSTNQLNESNESEAIRIQGRIYSR